MFGKQLGNISVKRYSLNKLEIYLDGKNKPCSEPAGGPRRLQLVTISTAREKQPRVYYGSVVHFQPNVTWNCLRIRGGLNNAAEMFDTT